MTPTPAHITIQGVPLCQCEAHSGGLMNKLHLKCGYKSIADARRAKLELQKHVWGVKVVKGACPA